VQIPTGLGKTAMVILGWLWRRFHGREEVRAGTPRRLIYCLPMRVLVEQTRENAQQWVEKLFNSGELPEQVPVYVLMGGEDDCEWDLHPEQAAILIGTQDMLLSRALNRGYAASRARWPMQFGLLNTDCLWIFDEIQLMGSGLATTAQLEAFRHLLGRKDGHGCKSVWMSATMQTDWLKTVDFDPFSLPLLELNENDNGIEEVRRRTNAKKPLVRPRAKMGETDTVAADIVKVHMGNGGRTLVVINTVRRACEVFDAIEKLIGSPDPKKEKQKKQNEVLIPKSW
jgi:CRISPR-associated endonuclease/helicase Cas3